MIYRDFKCEKISALGLGMMRLPSKPETGIDEKQLAEMLDLAMEGGINYFDTAWGYHGGMSERMVGKYLTRFERNSYFLADKFPGYDISNFGKAEEIFEEQLIRCQTEYFDFYLFHCLNGKNLEFYLDDENYHTASYLLEQKRKGRIRHLGFSVHAEDDVVKRFLEAYGDEMEFCQIQLNYLDWHFQSADKKVELLREHDIPIGVMEPLRGGWLASLPKSAAAELSALRPDEKIPAWAFRFLQSLPGIGVTLSGMSSLEQISENIKTFEEEKPLTSDEFKTLTGIADKMVRGGVLPCTACRYCTEYCPIGLDIPRLLAIYNEHSFTGDGVIAPMVTGALPADKRPDTCISCRSCEAVCPQGIKISEAMKKLSEM